MTYGNRCRFEEFLDKFWQTDSVEEILEEAKSLVKDLQPLSRETYNYLVHSGIDKSFFMKTGETFFSLLGEPEEGIN